MAARIPLAKGLATATQSVSIPIRKSEPPYLFVVPAKDNAGNTWTGSVAIQQSVDTFYYPEGNTGAGNFSGVTDANASWITIISTINPGDQVEWRNPLYRIRADGTNITGGVPNVYMLESPQSNKTQRKTPTAQAKAKRGS
jgi:hypothetical protein